MFDEKNNNLYIHTNTHTAMKLLKSLHPFQMGINTLPSTHTEPNSKIKSDSLNWHYTRHALKRELTFIFACAYTHTHIKKHMPMPEFLSDKIIHVRCTWCQYVSYVYVWIWLIKRKSQKTYTKMDELFTRIHHIILISKNSTITWDIFANDTYSGSIFLTWCYLSRCF